MKEFYKKFIQTFKTKKQDFILNNLTPVKYIDLYAGQDRNEESFQAQVYPALFIQWTIDYDKEPAIVSIHLKYVHNQLRDTSNISRSPDKSLQFLDAIDLVDTIFKAIETKNCGKPVLKKEGFNDNETTIDVYELDYELSYTGKHKNAKQSYEKGSIEDLNIKSNLYKKLLNS